MDIIEDAQRMLQAYGDMPVDKLIRVLIEEAGVDMTEEKQITRDTQFRGFADVLFDEIARRYITMFSLRALGEEDKADHVAHGIREIIAQHDYDLVRHTLEYVNENDNLMMGMWYAEDIPDLTKQPEKPDGQTV